MASSHSTTIDPAPIKYRLSTLEGFLSGAAGACLSVTFTNPMEVAKTRLQLDGELRAKGSPKTYINTYDVLSKTFKSEGIRGCQRGLSAAYAYQIFLNGSRLGFYEPIRRQLSLLASQDPNTPQIWSSMTAGATSGAIGALLGNPLFLVKARIQAYAPGVTLGSSGARHAYKNARQGLSDIRKREGIRGWARGMDAALLRTAMGSAAQLPAYNYAKSHLSTYLPSDSIFLYLLSSSFSGLCTLIMMQPADTALTRMYNQSSEAGKRLYKNPIDCLWQTAKVEGFWGLYKGSVAHFFRIAPHTVITLVANEGFSQWWIARQTAKQNACRTTI